MPKHGTHRVYIAVSFIKLSECQNTEHVRYILRLILWKVLEHVRHILLIINVKFSVIISMIINVKFSIILLIINVKFSIIMLIINVKFSIILLIINTEHVRYILRLFFWNVLNSKIRNMQGIDCGQYYQTIWMPKHGKRDVYIALNFVKSS